MTTNNVIQYGFVAGEVSPDFYGRTDLDKYPLGVKTLTNFFVDYRGPAVTRPGFRFGAPIGAGEFNHRLVRFRALSDDYILVFLENVMRVFRNDGYILEAGNTITAVENLTTVRITVVSNTVAAGQLVFINAGVNAPELQNQYFVARSVSASTIDLETFTGEDVVASVTTLGTSPQISQVYEIATTFTDAQLPNLRFEQDKSRCIITSVEVDRHELFFNDSDDWEISVIPDSNDLPAPPEPNGTASTSGSAGVAFAITATVGGKEGPASPTHIETSIVNYTATAGSLRINWDAVVDADFYSVYRSLVLPTGSDVTGAEFLGFVSNTYTTQFTDNNITPDFTKSPPGTYNPFAKGAITTVNVTAGGSGYANTDEVTITSPVSGTGFSGRPIVNASGAILSVAITNPGSGYALTNVSLAPDDYTVAISGSGSGATMYMKATGLTGLNPRCFTRFQQRDLYAGSLTFPMTLWATRPESPNDFSLSPIINAGDGYVFQIDDNNVQPINHTLALRSGLLLFTQTGVFLLRAEEGQAVSAVNALSEPQAYKGSSTTRPILIDIDVLFVEDKGSSLNAMMYTEYTNTFKLQDISVLANHMVSEGKRITDMQWISEPNRLLYCLREDGRIAVVTYERPNEVYGWSLMETAGLFRQQAVGTIAGQDYLHVGVERTLPTGNITYLEVQTPRHEAYTEDNFCVDCGLSYNATLGAASMTVSSSVNPASVSDTHPLLTTTGDAFDDVSVDDVIFFGGARATVTSKTNANNIRVWYTRPMTAVHPQTTPPTPNRIAAGAWEWVTKISTVGGLWHLEGATVHALADGDAYRDLVVTDGQIELNTAAARIHVGLPYSCKLTTLSPTFAQTIIEGKKKDIVSMALRLKNTRGIAVGMEGENIVEVKNRTYEDWGEQIRALNNFVEVALNAGWDYTQSVSIEQNYPLPATILSLTMEVLEGDD